MVRTLGNKFIINIHLRLELLKRNAFNGCIVFENIQALAPVFFVVDIAIYG